MALLHFVQISYLFLFVQMCESQFSETQHGKKYYIKIVIVSRMLRKTFPQSLDPTRSLCEASLVGPNGQA